VIGKGIFVKAAMDFGVPKFRDISALV